MKPALVAAAALLSAWCPPARAQQDDKGGHRREAVSIQPHGGGFERGSSGAGVSRGSFGVAPQARSPSVIMRMRRVQVPQPRAPAPEQRVQSGVRPVPLPPRDANGAPMRREPARTPPAHSAIVNNRIVTRNITNLQRTEIVPNRYVWHDVNGTRFCHYYDGRAHWYGFHWGTRFYWTRYWGDYWWWYDPVFFRWVYWWDGYWWWPGPAGVPFVYVDNAYYPYEDGQVIVKNPTVGQPAPEAPATAEAGREWRSPDGRRMVQVTGDQGEAFLYDTTSGSPAYLNYLARGVEQARFSGGTRGKPLRILLDFTDGSFALFDADGNAIDSKSPSTAVDGGVPEEVPGPPPQEPSAPSGPTTPPPRPPGQ